MGTPASDPTPGGGPRESNGEITAWDAFDASVLSHLRSGLFAATDNLSAGPFAELDSAGLSPSLGRVAIALATEPLRVADIFGRFGAGMLRAGYSFGVRAAGLDVAGPDLPRDKRYTDPAWSQNAVFALLRELHALTEQASNELVDAAEVDDHDRRKAHFAVQAVLDALAPANFPLTNPTVLKRTIETGGRSSVRGLRTFLTDVAVNGGRPQQVAVGVHEVGRNLAVTPGKVVFRNELMELIQYSPTTDKVHEIPLLFSPPWINKYYIMDLAPGRSLVEWAVSHGHTVFLISYRNPDASMSDVTMDDYLLSGPRAALDVITEITGAKKVNLLGLCLGGTLTMATLAYLDATGEDLINSATFLNTMLDFSEPGALGLFTDEAAVVRLEDTMRRTGFLPGEDMRGTFDALRANDLIWNYVVHNWLLGEDPPAFDILTWNADSTRMPATMHSFYLRNCYLENRLARGELSLAGQSLDVQKVDQDLYFLAAEQDHIAPWRSSYAGARLPAGKVRFVLSNSGHIAGIVNPPNPKSRHYVGPDGPLPEDPQQWLAAATMHPITWWEDWAGWIGKRAGRNVDPPSIGSKAYPPLADAPGSYVRQQ